MSEATSALNGASYDGIARVQEMGLQGMITLRGDLGSAAVKKAATKAAGVTMPATNMAVSDENGAICWMSPDELLVLCAHDKAEANVAAMTKTLGKAHSLAVNVSDARAMFRVSGPLAREVMAKLCPVDFAPGNFTPDMFRRSRLAQVPAAFWMRDEDSFDVICFRSVADYVFGALKMAAQPGSKVGVFNRPQAVSK